MALTPSIPAFNSTTRLPTANSILSAWSIRLCNDADIAKKTPVATNNKLALTPSTILLVSAAFTNATSTNCVAARSSPANPVATVAERAATSAESSTTALSASRWSCTSWVKPTLKVSSGSSSFASSSSSCSSRIGFLLRWAALTLPGSRLWLSSSLAPTGGALLDTASAPASTGAVAGTVDCASKPWLACLSSSLMVSFS